MEILLATAITCSSFNSIIIRLYKNLNLTAYQKIQIAKELKEYTKICPLPIRRN